MTPTNPQQNPARLSALQLESQAFTDVRITAQVEGKPEGALHTLVNFGGQPLDATKRRWQLLVTVNLMQVGEIKPTYLGTIECVGLFNVAPNVPEDKVEKLVVVNGTGILYASIRELVSNITARGPWPMLTLVTQSFVASYDEAKAKVKESEVEVFQKKLSGSTT